MTPEGFGSGCRLDRAGEDRVRQLATPPGCVVRIAWWAAVIMGAAWLFVTLTR